MELQKVEMKIVLKNNLNERLSVELFDSGRKTLPDIDCDVITEKIDGKYSQTYDCFLDNLNYESLIIEDVRSTEDERLKIFQKDILEGRKPIRINDNRMMLFRRSIWVIDLLPKEEFVIDFTVVFKQNRSENFDSL